MRGENIEEGYYFGSKILKNNNSIVEVEYEGTEVNCIAIKYESGKIELIGPEVRKGLKEVKEVIKSDVTTEEWNKYLEELEQAVDEYLKDPEKTLDEYLLETLYPGVKVGDFVNYDPTAGATQSSYTSLKGNTGHTEDQTFVLTNYTDKWRVLGVEDGKLKLVSNSIVEPSTGGVQPSGARYYYVLNGEKGYLYGIDELNSIGALYGQGQYAESGRSINANDFMQASVGYYPGSRAIEDYSNQSLIAQHGVDVTYGIENGKLVYRGTNGATAEVDKEKFYYCDTETKNCLTYNELDDISIQQKYKVTNTLLEYWPIRYFRLTNNQDFVLGEKNISWYNLLYKHAWLKNQYSDQNQTYWVASERKFANSQEGKGYVSYGLYYATTHGLYLKSLTKPSGDGSTLSEKSDNNAIRPVVILQSNISLESAGTTTSDGTDYNVWNITTE